MNRITGRCLWRKLFCKPQRFVEVIGTSNQRQVMSHDEFVSRTIAENRVNANFGCLGFLTRREPKHVIEHVMRHWMI
jgi:hypothetical protein